MNRELETELFRIQIGSTNNIFVEAHDWQDALAIAEKMAPKIFSGPITEIQVIGTHSQFKGVWV
jgi:hypothetical protein